MTRPLSAPSPCLPLLLLLLLAPGVGLASPLAASSGLPGTAARAPLRLSGDSPSLEAEPPRPFPGLRILAEVGAGLLTGAASGTAGLLLGYHLCQEGLIGTRGGWFSCLGEAFLGLYAAVPVGLALGVWWGGEVAGGDGKLLGLLGGWGTGALVTILVAVVTQMHFQASFFFVVPGSLIGAIVGYELSQRAPEPGLQARGMASTRPRLQPVLAFSPHGAMVGLGGSF